jgi:L-rhamnose-H+ transport protein
VSTLLGIFFHTIGGFCAGTFYLPLKKIKRWSWESYWLINGIVAWLIMPLIIAVLVVPDLRQVYSESPVSNIAGTYLFGVLWGVGGITFGLTMRFLGMALGMALALGLTAIIGTIVPPAYSGELLEIMVTNAGKVTLLGVAMIGLGIVFCGLAGMSKDKDITDSGAGYSSDGGSATIPEFNLLKGIWVALIAGIMSACMAFGLASGKPIAEAALKLGVGSLWQNTPVLVVVFGGGLTTNLVWCILLNWKNRSFSDYGNFSGVDFYNYLLCIAAGVIWYSQFMFYGMGATYMGKLEFAGWSLHMGFIILFSTMWGFITKEWHGATRKTLNKNFAGLALIILAIMVVGYGNFLQYAGS